MRTYTRFAWSVLAYHVVVMAWGALVRATGSGAGCGRHWPMCNGEVVPRSPAVETVIEFTHRLTSGVAVVLVVLLVIAARRAFPRGHAARAAAVLALVFLLVEAALGAGLVLFGWVARDASAARGVAMALHLMNTFLLLGALALAAGLGVPRAAAAPARSRGSLVLLVAAGLGATALAGATGGIAALGDTLFPATSFAAGLEQELTTTSHVLLRLRIVHPFAALVSGALLAGAAHVAAQVRPQRHVQRAALAVGVLVALQVAAGAANVLLLAPVWLQVTHLVLADLLWVAFVLVSAWSLAPGEVAAAEDVRLEGALARG